MPRVPRPRVLPSPRSDRPTRARASDPAMLRRIISTQGELSRAGLDPLKVVDIITRRAQELTRSSGAVVEMLDGSDMYYWSASGSAVAQLGLRIPVQGSLSGASVMARRALRCDDSETDPRVNRAACRLVGLRSAIVLPLYCDDALVGVLKVLSATTHAYRDEDVETLTLLGSFIGAALHHALEHEQLRARHQSEAEIEHGQRQRRAAQRERIDAVLKSPDLVAPVYQPIVDLATGREVGIEGLSRFPTDPGRRPDQWFADANESGLGVELELLCAQRVMTVLPSLPTEMYLGINLSPGALVSPQLDVIVTPEAAPRVVLELTETTEVNDYDALAQRLQAFRQLGARLAVDDAGAGFASLRHVLRLSPDSIKLDVSLTRGIDASRPRQTLAAAMLMFARETDANLVAEGIETVAELDTLRRLGVQFGQGYLLGRPGPR